MKAFDEYTKQFDMENDITLLKYNHSYRVSKLSNMLAKGLELNEENINLATLIGLIHDIGRFEQIKKFDTLSDIGTMDHADFGAYLLFEKGLITKFTNNTHNYEVIKNSVSSHNKYSIDYDCCERALMHINIIRDADKIDIMNLVVNLGEIKLSDDNLGVSKKVDESFRNHLSISHKDKLARNDSIIMMLAFVFDLNFDYSYRYYKDNNYIDLFYSKLKNKDIFSEYIEIANGYIEGKCNNVRTKIYS